MTNDEAPDGHRRQPRPAVVRWPGPSGPPAGRLRAGLGLPVEYPLLKPSPGPPAMLRSTGREGTHMHRSLARSIGSLIGIGGVAFSITLLSESMRAVLAVGGTCASGGPYAISRPCPNGVAGAFPLAIIGGLIFLGLYVFCASDKGRTVAILAWPALFLTLGWNFIDYGLKGGSGGGAGFLIP